jgi:hypothetical protein
LGERRPIRPPLDFRGRRLAARDRREDRHADSYVWRGRARQHARRHTASTRRAERNARAGLRESLHHGISDRRRLRIPHPGEFGYETWPEGAWKWAGGVNAWGEISIDERRGIAYFPLGSPTHDMFGGDRKGANLFGNSLLALDARTGKRLWHFQTVHHDIWDYDLTTAPKLLTIRHNGASRDIVAQATKFGLLYVFDRVTGEPIWPI